MWNIRTLDDLRSYVEEYRDLNVFFDEQGDGEMPLTGLKDKSYAMNMCGIVSRDFARWLNERLEADMDLETEVEILEDIDPHELGYPTGDEHVFEEGIIPHTVVAVHANDMMFMIDWTAAQYGLMRFPMIKQRIDDKWQDLQPNLSEQYPTPTPTRTPQDRAQSR